MRFDIADKMTCKPFKIALAVSFAILLLHMSHVAHADVTVYLPNSYSANFAVNQGSACGLADICFSGVITSPYDHLAIPSNASIFGINGQFISNWISGGSFDPSLVDNSTQTVFLCQSSYSNCISVGQFSVYGGVLAAVNTSTRIINLIPENGTTTASTTEIGATIYINSNDLSSTTAYNPQIQMTLTSPDNGTNLTFYFPSAAEPITTAGDQTFSATTTLQDGLYNVTTLLTVPPFGQFPGQTYDSTTTSFIVNESAYLALQNSRKNLAATTTCSILNLSGCVQNALVYLFWPDQNSLGAYTSFQSTLQAKAPAGYFLLIQKALTEATTSAATSTIPWNANAINFFADSPLADVRNGLAGLLWFFFLIEFWHRLRNIHL